MSETLCIKCQKNKIEVPMNLMEQHDGLCNECREQEEMKYIIPIPAYTDPNNLGSIVQRALQNNYSVTISAGTAGAITMTAMDAVKEKKMELKEVEVRVGPSWLGFTIKLSK